MPTVQLRDTHLFYQQNGEGIPCLVMHGGLGLDHSYLLPSLMPLGDTLKLIAYDHRGNGQSGRPPLDTLTFENFCSDADALRAHLGFAQVAVMGHSFGGCVALEYALRYPERVSHLILVGTTARSDLGSASAAARMERKGVSPEIAAAFSMPLDNNAALARFFAVAAPLYYHTFDAGLADRHLREVVFEVTATTRGLGLLQRWDLRSLLNEVRLPTLIVAGADDVIFPPSHAMALRDGIAGSQLVVFERSGHHPYAEEPVEYADVVRNWIGRVP